MCPRCGKIIEYNQHHCSNCDKFYQKSRSRYNKNYDIKRDSRYKVFYNSMEWRGKRDYILTRYKYIDLYEYYINNRLVQANTIHHIIEVREDWEERLDDYNLIPVSSSTHDKIHDLYRTDRKGTQAMLRKLLELWSKEFEDEETIPPYQRE